MHFAFCRQFGRLSLLHPANNAENMHEKPDWRTSPRLFASKFFCARQSRATAIFRQHIFVARAASDAFDVRTRTRFVDEEKNRFAFGGATRNNQSERTTRDWFDSGNDMIYILVLLQKLRPL